MRNLLKRAEAKTIVLIDAYSSGSLYPAEFKKRGHECVHVQSSLDLDPAWYTSFVRDDFIANIVHDGNVEKTIEALSQYHVAAVIAGSECGVMLADELSEKMGLKSNGTKLSETRRNKYLTHEILRQNGIRCADQIKSDNVDTILDWAEKRNIWPVVIKPLNSAGTEGVRICHATDEIKEAFTNISGKTNQMGFINAEVLAQEFLEGNEYVVNTVSCDGQHFVSDMFQENKTLIHDRFIVYQDEVLLASTGDLQKQLSDYAISVLTVLDVKYGPCHLEMMMTKKGPRLIEINARLHGCCVPKFVQACTGLGQVILAADSYIDQPQFFQKTKTPYILKKHGQILCFISKQEGILKTIRHKKDIERLSSLFGLKLNVDIGQYLKKTTDLDSCPGYVELVHENTAVIQRDAETVRAWERDGIFVISKN